MVRRSLTNDGRRKRCDQARNWSNSVAASLGRDQGQVARSACTPRPRHGAAGAFDLCELTSLSVTEMLGTFQQRPAGAFERATTYDPRQETALVLADRSDQVRSYIDREYTVKTARSRHLARPCRPWRILCVRRLHTSICDSYAGYSSGVHLRWAPQPQLTVSPPRMLGR